MEPLLPSEIARLVFGYLKKEKAQDAAECFLKSSPHLTECYQMFRGNRNFNVKVNGFHLHDIFDIFGTMCSMINERVSDEVYESKTLIEKLQLILDSNHISTKEDKCVETELIMVDKCVGCSVNTENKSILIDIEPNATASKLSELPSIAKTITSNDLRTNEIDSNSKIINSSVEKNLITQSSPCLYSTPHIVDDNENSQQFHKVEDKESCMFQINEKLCSTPTKTIGETKNSTVAALKSSPKNIHDQFSSYQPEYQQIPEATSLESMPGLSKEDKIKDNSVVIDTGELVDTFLNDKSLLEKIADSINKSMEAQRDDEHFQEGGVLDPPTLEKAIDSTQSDPQIKNVLDEFLVFNVDSVDDSKKLLNEQETIKSRLRSAKKKDVSIKSKKNNLNIQKYNSYNNEECLKIDSNIMLIHENNVKTTIFEHCDLLSNQIILQTNDSNVGLTRPLELPELRIASGQPTNYNTNGMEEESYMDRSYVKIAPKLTPMFMTQQAPEKRIFPKRRKKQLDGFGIKSKFRRTNITPMQPSKLICSPQSIIIEVPNQNSLDNQTKTNSYENNVIRLPEVPKESSKVKNVIGKVEIIHDTPDDRLKPPKNKSMSTPRRRSTHIRCLDFSTPQPKNNARDQARSKLFNDTPKRCEKIVEESISSPLPKLQADWGSVNGFESIVKKDNPPKDWDSDIREMVGAGVLTSDADGRKTRKKKTPRKKIKSANNKINNELELEQQNESNCNLIQSNDESNHSNNTSKNQHDVNENNCDNLLLDDQKPLKEQSVFPISLESSNKSTEICIEKSSIISDSLNDTNNLESLKHQSEFPISLEIPGKVPALYSEQSLNKSDSLKNFNELKLLKPQTEFSISLETPDKVTELHIEQPTSDSVINFDDPKSLKNKNQTKMPVSLETPDKAAELLNVQPLNKTDSLKDFNGLRLLKTQTEFSISLETPDKITEFHIEGPPNQCDSPKSFDDPKLMKPLREFSISFDTPNKTSEPCDVQTPIATNYLKSPHETQNNPSQFENNINEQENDLNQLNTLTIIDKATTSSKLKSVPETTNKSQNKDSNFLQTFNNHNNLKPSPIEYSKKNESTEDLKNQTSLGVETNISNELNSPAKHVNIQPIKQSLMETPYKCDDAAVDVPETPISKLIREYDPSKLITPLPSTPMHFEDSLSETPLTKVFRETSYLNRPPISPFPPTPGNSRSVDTLIEPPVQEVSKTSNDGMTCKINSLKDLFTQPIQTSFNNKLPTKKKEVKVNKCTPLKTKTKLSTKTKTKNGLKEKKVEVKKKQVYESVKAELFGSEYSSSLSADESIANKQQTKMIINKVTPKKEKKSGFKPIPKRKVVESIAVNGIENSMTNEFNSEPNKSLIKPAIVQREKSTLNKMNKMSNIKQTNKSKKSMVHFEDPVEKFLNFSMKPVTKKPSNAVANEAHNNPATNKKSDQLIGLSRYLNKSTTFYECTTNKNNYKIKPNNSDSNIHYSKICEENQSNENVSKMSPTSTQNKTKTHEIDNQKNKLSKNCIKFEDKISDEKQSNTANNDSNIQLDFVKSRSVDTKTIDQICISNNKTNNTSVQKSDLSACNNMTNTSCVTFGHNDEFDFQLEKVDNSLNNMEYLKKTKVYEIITEDGDHEMVYLNLSEAFTFLDIPSELNSLQSNFDPNISPLIKNKEFDASPKIEDGELVNDLIPVTSTPKDSVIAKNDEKQSRARRSPSFWEDSLHNYPTKHRDDRYRDSNNWRSKNNRDSRYDYKYCLSKSRYHDERLQSSTSNRWNQKSHHLNSKRDFRDDVVRDKERFKHKDDKRRKSYRDYSIYDDRKGRDRMEESERFSNPQRISQNDSQKLNRTEDTVKKATKRPSDRTDYNKIPSKVSKVEHQRLLKNVDVDDFLSVVHGQK